MLGKHPEDGQAVALYSGKYGPYVKHGKVNATLPDEDMITTVTLEEARGAARREVGQGRQGKGEASRRRAKPKAAKVKKAA